MFEGGPIFHIEFLSHGAMVVKIKFILLEVALFCVIIAVVGRVVYRHVLYPQYCWLAEEEGLQECLNVEVTTGVHTGYDFTNMIDLIKTVKTLKRKVKNSFFQSKVRPIKVALNSEEIYLLLRHLEVERSKFTEYIWELKGYEKSALTARRDRSLQYYLHVLDAAIIEVCDVIKIAEKKRATRSG